MSDTYQLTKEGWRKLENGELVCLTIGEFEMVDRIYGIGRATILAQLKEAAKGLMTSLEIRILILRYRSSGISDEKYEFELDKLDASITAIRAIAEGRE